VTLGMVVRDDNGGLGNLTYEVWRHLRPEVTMVVQSRPCRGEPHPDLFQAGFTKTINVANPVSRRQWREAAQMADVWWTAETWYCDEAETVLNEAGVRSVLYAMPELFAGSNATEVWNPTQYLHDRLPERAEVVLWPTTVSQQWALRMGVRRIIHLSGGAQYDRNGTELFLEALRRVREPCEVMLHQPDVSHRVPARVLAKLPSNVEVKQTRDYFTNLNSLYRWGDLLVLPRRYAGLCLPAYEMFALGGLVMMPDTSPQNRWPITPCDAVKEQPRRMKGGRVPMVSVDPARLARRLDALLTADVESVVRASEQGRLWAEANSWELRLSEWKERLCG
jgi:hypothetical protein